MGLRQNLEVHIMLFLNAQGNNTICIHVLLYHKCLHKCLHWNIHKISTVYT